MGTWSRGKKKQEWYESNLLWGSATTVLAIFCIWVPTTKADLHWLIWLAWLIALYPFWIVVNNLFKKPLYKTVFFPMLLLLSAIGTDYFYKALQPIAVSPPEAKLANLFGQPQGMMGNLDFSVYNRGEDPYYEIWVKILVDSGLLSAQNIDLDFPSIEERIKAGGDAAALAVGSGCLRGVDKDSHEFRCIIDALTSKDVFKIRLTTSHDHSGLSDELIGLASIEVISFSSESGKRFQNPPGKETRASAMHMRQQAFSYSDMIHVCPKITKAFESNSRITCTPNSKGKIETK